VWHMYVAPLGHGAAALRVMAHTSAQVQLLASRAHCVPTLTREVAYYVVCASQCHVKHSAWELGEKGLEVNDRWLQGGSAGSLQSGHSIIVCSYLS
jgi:hypothetical protein